jgi:acetyl esterase
MIEQDPIEPGLQAYLEHTRRVTAGLGPLGGLTPGQRRERAERYALATQEPHPPGLHTRTAYIVLPGREIPVRIYRPPGPARAALVYLHGGSWIAGSPETHDFVTASLAMNTGAQVLSVHYRRAPENPYPAPTEDALAALRWALGHAAALGLDPARIGLAGDSAGGNLAAGASLMARDRGGPGPACLVLIYPVLDRDLDTPSYRAARDPILTREAMREAFDAFAPPVNDPFALPLRAPDLSGLPPCLLSIAERDPLRDEGLAFAARLRAAGVPVWCREAPGMIHSYPRARRHSAAAEAEFQQLCAAIRAALNLPDIPPW